MDEDKLDYINNDRFDWKDKKTHIKKTKHSIDLIKRNTENNTHSNIVDDSIHEIISYRIVRWKFFFCFVLHILTFGLFYILTKIFPKFYLLLNCTPCKISEANIFAITDEENNCEIVDSELQNFSQKNPTIFTKQVVLNVEPQKAIKNSRYTGEDSYNKTEVNIVVYYRYNKYYYNEIKRKFESVKFDLSKFTNKEIYEHLGQGIKDMSTYNYLLNKFGENIMILSEKSIFYFIMQQLIHPFYLYQIYTIVVWFRTGYYSFNIVIILMATITLFTSSLQQFKSYNKLIKYQISASSNVIRDFREEYENRRFANNKNQMNYLVPGDLIEITHGKILPCDCVLIDGFCTVNESNLTGESTLIMKRPIPIDDNKFDYRSNNKSILYAGTLIDKCESSNKKGNVSAIVINTGFNTQKGNLVQSILFPKPSNFKFFKDIYIFIIGMLLIYGVAIYFLIYINQTREDKTQIEDTSKIITRCLDGLTIVIPATLPICLTFSSYYFHYILKVNKISCVNERRLNAAGRVNIVIFDKTGTLTEEALQLYGFQTTFLNSSIKSSGSNEESNQMIKKENESFKLEIDEVERTAKVYKYLYRKFWKEYFNDSGFIKSKRDSKINNIYFEFLKKEKSESQKNFDNFKISLNEVTNEAPKFKKMLSLLEGSKDYQNDPKFNLIYFFECLGTCHSIDKLNGKYFGNTIDTRIFENLGWLLLRSDENYVDAITKTTSTNPITRDHYLHYYTMPKKSYKITEDYIFKNLNNTNEFSNTDFKLKIIKRFEFSSKFQSMSVIIQNSVDKSFRYYIKGAPEKIHSMCLPESIPVDFNDHLVKHTYKGFRVIACATKILQNKENFYEYETERSKYENKLNFLGFIIFKNKIKKDSKHVIAKLNSSKSKLIISTGDNPFTSISVGRECGFFQKITKIFMIDVDKTKSDFLHFSYINHQPDKQVKADVDKENYIPIEEEKLIEEDKNKEIKITPDNSQRKFLVDNFKSEKSDKSDNYSSNQHFLEINNLKNFISLCKEMKGKNFAIVISGSALNYLFQQKALKEKLIKNSKKKKILFSKKEDENYRDILLILELVENYGKIFYRMSPQDKVDLVSFFKKNPDNIVSMCGDGANDCGALMCADVGISINQKENANLQSHFYCEGESITKIEIILKIGRACFENNMIIFKIMIIYAILQLCTYTMLYYSYSDLTDNQYFFVDCAIILVNCLLISRTSPNFKNIKQKPHKSILNLRFYLSVIGQIVIQLGILLVYYFFFLLKNIENSKKNEAELDKSLSFYNSYVLLLTLFQYTSTIFIFNEMAKFKKGNFSNVIYILYTSFIGFFITNMLTINKFENISENFSLIYMV